MRSTGIRLALALAIPSLLPVACNRGGSAYADAGAPSQLSNVELEAKDFFAGRCAPCHGYQGKGDGPAASELKPRPADLSNPVWQRSVTDDQVLHVIVQGGKTNGKSNQMPPNPDLGDRAALVNALVRIVRGFGTK